jgi:hypothetical protein
MSDEKLSTVSHEYEINNATILVEIAFIGQKRFRKLLKKSEKTTWKNHQRVSEPDELLLRQQVMREGLVNVKDAKYRDVKYLLEPSTTFTPPKGRTWDDKFEMTEENKTILTEQFNEGFFTFVFEASRDAALYIEAQEEKEKANLGPGSSTKPAKKD